MSIRNSRTFGTEYASTVSHQCICLVLQPKIAYLACILSCYDIFGPQVQQAFREYPSQQGCCQSIPTPSISPTLNTGALVFKDYSATNRSSPNQAYIQGAWENDSSSAALCPALMSHHNTFPLGCKEIVRPNDKYVNQPIIPSCRFSCFCLYFWAIRVNPEFW